MASAWKHPESIPDFVDCPSHILVWNECNGVSEIAVDPNDIYAFREGRSGWRLWREVPKPSEKDIERAVNRAFSTKRGHEPRSGSSVCRKCGEYTRYCECHVTPP